MNTLAEIIPKPKPGDWYFVTTKSLGNKKIVVTIKKDGSLLQDNNYAGEIDSHYLNPMKISYEEARNFVKKTIFECQPVADQTGTNNGLIGVMGILREDFYNRKIFYREFFHEDLELTV